MTLECSVTMRYFYDISPQASGIEAERLFEPERGEGQSKTVSSRCDRVNEHTELTAAVIAYIRPAQYQASQDSSMEERKFIFL